MITTDEIRAMLLDVENDRVERTISTTNTEHRWRKTDIGNPNLGKNEGKLKPRTEIPTQLIKNVYKLIKMNRKIKYSQLEDNLGVDENTIWRVIGWLKANGYINPEHSKVKGESSKI